MKYLVSIFSNSDGYEKTYLKTVHNVSNSIRKINVAFKPYPEMWVGEIIKIDKPYQGNLGRFDYFPTGFDDDDLIIFTDSSDVIFQDNLCHVLNGEITVCPENDVWGADNWWKTTLDLFFFDELNNFMIYNAGCWAMPYKKVKELLEFMKKNAGRFNNIQCSDQILFNWWLKTEKINISTSVMGCLYNGLNSGTIVKKGSKYYDYNGRLISIIHGNGNTKKLLFKQTT